MKSYISLSFPAVSTVIVFSNHYVIGFLSAAPPPPAVNNVQFL